MEEELAMLRQLIGQLQELEQFYGYPPPPDIPFSLLQHQLHHHHHHHHRCLSPDRSLLHFCEFDFISLLLILLANVLEFFFFFFSFFIFLLRFLNFFELFLVCFCFGTLHVLVRRLNLLQRLFDELR